MHSYVIRVGLISLSLVFTNLKRTLKLKIKIQKVNVLNNIFGTKVKLKIERLKIKRLKIRS